MLSSLGLTQVLGLHRPIAKRFLELQHPWPPGEIAMKLRRKTRIGRDRGNGGSLGMANLDQ
ncbi:MAG: hypothetical protein ACK439_03345, partial [Novosphingobium sp.]